MSAKIGDRRGLEDRDPPAENPGLPRSASALHAACAAIASLPPAGLRQRALTELLLEQGTASALSGRRRPRSPPAPATLFLPQPSPMEGRVKKCRRQLVVYFKSVRSSSQCILERFRYSVRLIEGFFGLQLCPNGVVCGGLAPRRLAPSARGSSRRSGRRRTPRR